MKRRLKMSIFKETQSRTQDLYTILNILKNCKQSYDEIKQAMVRIENGFIRIRYNPKMLFYSLDDPSNMPSDARVELAYEPTYLACSVMMCAACLEPALVNEERYHLILHDGLEACTGRRFLGHGYDETDGFLTAMKIFAECDVALFVKKFPNFNEHFTNLFQEAKEYLRNDICSGKVKNAWSKKDYVDIATPIYKALTHNSM